MGCRPGLIADIHLYPPPKKLTDDLDVARLDRLCPAVSTNQRLPATDVPPRNEWPWLDYGAYVRSGEVQPDYLVPGSASFLSFAEPN